MVYLKLLLLLLSLLLMGFTIAPTSISIEVLPKTPTHIQLYATVKDLSVTSDCAFISFQKDVIIQVPDYIKEKHINCTLFAHDKRSPAHKIAIPVKIAVIKDFQPNISFTFLEGYAYQNTRLQIPVEMQNRGNTKEVITIANASFTSYPGQHLLVNATLAHNYTPGAYNHSLSFCVEACEQVLVPVIIKPKEPFGIVVHDVSFKRCRITFTLSSNVSTTVQVNNQPLELLLGKHEYILEQCTSRITFTDNQRILEEFVQQKTMDFKFVGVLITIAISFVLAILIKKFIK